MQIFFGFIFFYILIICPSISFSQVDTTGSSSQINYDNSLNKPKCDLYREPYSLWRNCPDSKRLGSDMASVGIAGVAAITILYFMPESFTNWDRDELKPNKVFSKWASNVKAGPVIDHDDWILNWAAHPYCGAIYYMTARSAGLNLPYSFLFSFAMSTFFWEYGIEAFAEVPSLQDVILTPGVGFLLGEVFYLAKRAILANDYRILGSKFIGHFSIFLMDPLNEIMDLIEGKNKRSQVSLSIFPSTTINKQIGCNIELGIRF